MILLDTNVISEMMKSAPDQRVRDWLDAQAAETLFISSVNVAELLFGVGALPNGQRKDALSAALNDILLLFSGRILTFDDKAARHYADIAVRARQSGRGFPVPDGYMAAIAAANGFAIASRDTSAFAAAGLEIIDPWQSIK